MINIVGLRFNKKLKLGLVLSLIYGIGKSKSFLICRYLGFNYDSPLSSFSSNNIINLSNYIENNVVIEKLLKKEVSNDINFLKKIGCYRGNRHKNKLPVRGQRSKTNSRTFRKLAR
jgi:small subunit ribosomal protein S13